MRAFEVKKGEVEIKRGRVMMAIEGDANKVDAIAKELENAGYPSTKCSEYNDGNLCEFFMISRSHKADFMVEFKAAKHGV